MAKGRLVVTEDEVVYLASVCQGKVGPSNC